LNVLGRECQNKEEGNGIQSPICPCQVSLPCPDALDELGFYQGHWKLYEKQIAQTILCPSRRTFGNSQGLQMPVTQKT